MDQIQVRESNGEVLIFLDRHMGDRLNALQEAYKIIGREVIREKLRNDNNPNRQAYDDELPRR